MLFRSVCLVRFNRIRMCAFQLFLSLDPSLGRVSYSLMSDQILMEMFIEGFSDETKRKYRDRDGMYLDVCKWPRIECDIDERVTKILVGSEGASSSLELCYVPPKVKMLMISSLGESTVTGSVDLTRLPNGMKYLSFADNELIGEIDLAHLPDRMVHLSLSRNEFTGEIDLTQLPEGIKYLYLSHNQLSGSLFIRNLPQSMIILVVIGNHFDDIAVVDSKTRAAINLKESGVTSVVDENGRARDIKRFLH